MRDPMESRLAKETRILAQARRLLMACEQIPHAHPPPLAVVDQARTMLRAVRDLLAEIEEDAQARTRAAVALRDELSTWLYCEALTLTVESIGADAGRRETTVRRVAARKGSPQRRPRKRRPTTDQTPPDSSDTPAGERRNVADTASEIPAESKIARMYSLLLDPDSPHAYDADRRLMAHVKRTHPEITFLAQQNRAFMRRAVRFLTRAGITQFLDIGTGIPTQGNVHEVAQEINPAARVLYVDRDPLVLTYADTLLANNPGAAMIYGDARHMDHLIGQAQAQGVLDFSRPIAVLALSVLHYVAEGAHDGLARLRKILAPGSHLAITHVCDGEEFVQAAQDAAGGTTVLLTRTRAQIAEFFGDMDLITPGLVPLTSWRPDTPRLAEQLDPQQVWMLAGVARQPQRAT